MTNEQIVELDDYAKLEGSEIGDYAIALIDLINAGASAGADDAFMDHVHKEAERLLNEFKTDYRIEEFQVMETRTRRELKYKDE